MKISLKIARILAQLINGNSIASSTAKSKLIDDLVVENILFRKGKHKKTITLKNEEALHNYLANQLQIHSLDDYILLLENEHSTQAEYTNTVGDSKQSKERSFKGFLVNAYHPILTKLNNKDFIINPDRGSFTFIYDYETFKIPKEVTVVGIENANNFRYIQEQQYLFKNITPLFISRYPQNQSKDFIKWIKSIPNNYIHFGDFDLAGIGIYLNEYKKHLSEKALFFIPENIERDIKRRGIRERYNNQGMNFNIEDIQEVELLELIKIINLIKKGLDQQYYIKHE